MGCCCDSKSANLDVATPDPGKHVNYLLGMVLGEDDFRQEFAYHANRDQWLARDLIGYGTVRGLAVSTEAAGSNELRVRVEAGVALSPNGQLICVPEAQCAELNGWLKANADAVRAAAGSPPAKLTLYLTLCYRACPTDAMPIPGEPCRSDAELTQPSRLADDFCLGFKLQPPPQREEDAIRDFCRWLRLIDMRDNGQPSTAMADFLAAIGAAAGPWLGSPPDSPPASPPADYLFDSPPAALHIAPADVVEYLRAAFQLWITELRPKWVQRSVGCAPNCPPPQPDDCCSDDLLLAEFALDLVEQGGVLLAQVLPKPEPIIQPAPSLLHLRMLQEWLLGALGESAVPRASNALPTGISFGQASLPGSSEDYSRADHQHAMTSLPDLDGDVSGAIDANVLTSLQGNAVKAAAPGDGQALTCLLEETGERIWQPVALDGDVQGGINSNQVKALQGKTLDLPAPSDGQVLTFRTDQWVAEAPANAAVPLPATTVTDETRFGVAPDVGSNAAYARADHTHGTPSLLGDVQIVDAGDTGMLNQLVQLQGIDVKAAQPVDGQLLGYSKADNAWLPVDAPQGGSGLVVTRPIQQAYSIVAAGWLEIGIDFGNDVGPFEGQKARVNNSYNRLRPVAPYSDKLGGLRLTFGGFKPDISYIVKLTPWIDAGQERAGIPALFCSGFFAQDDNGPAGVGVVVLSPNTDVYQSVRFMVEVSQFEPDNQG